MTNRKFADIFKNAVGTMFLLAGAFFVCSTLLSMRAVFADPIAPIVTTAGAQSPRAGATARASGRVATGRGTTNATVARTTNNAQGAVARSVTGRPTVASRATSATTSTARGNASTTASRGVASRTTAVGRNTASRTGNVARNVVARTATNPNARISLTGSAIRGSKAQTTNTAYSYLSGKLYTGNYSNIIDPTTGLISADAYNNCMESYYTCMDEICTARNAAQRRCACAGRVKAFAEAEAALETANEELIKVSGELALLIATKGKDVSEAFQLTDAEKVMNCVSWRDASKNGTASETEFGDWCAAHGIFDNSCSNKSAPSYCKVTGNTFDFDVENLDGDGSDILASLQSWANAKEQTLTIVANDNENLFNSVLNISGIANGLGLESSLAASDDLKDSLAETWGYELFEYAHNNVCNRVLDSCFNGIYEACGTPPSTGRKCSNGAAQCPYNYNTMVSVNNTGTYELNFVTGNSGYTSSNSASCFGYTSSSGDPYSNLRGPVADARRSIMQKYALDANADCDLYGEQLRQTAQNIGYQKVAAQQALQKKRLEFAQEEVNTIATEYRSAISNFNECLAELYDCYTTQETANKSWSTSRIKTYCSQVSNAPHCYEQMICGAPNSTLQAVIDKDDNKNEKCANNPEYSTNTCRNIITIAEILSGSYASGAVEGSGVQMREACLQKNGIEGVRNWKTSSPETTAWEATEEQCTVAGYDFDANAKVCIPKTAE